MTDHKTRRIGPEWQVQPVKFEKPSWAEYCIPGRPYESIMEIGSALGAEYPHFHAVLTDERNFLHYLIAELICNVAIPDEAHKGLKGKDYLAQQVERLYKPNLERLHQKIRCAEYEQLGEIALDIVRNWAANYYDQIKSNKTYSIPNGADLETIFNYVNIREIKSLQRRRDREKSTHDFDPDETKVDAKVFHERLENRPFDINDLISDIGKTARTGRDEAKSLRKKDRKLAQRIERKFGRIYDQYLTSVSKRYLRGKNDPENLDTPKKLFIAAAVNEWERWEHEYAAKELAREIVKKEITEGHLTALPTHDNSKRKQTVISGNIAAGKTVLLSKLEREKEIDRSKCVMIDIDEFRDLSEIVKKEAEGDPEQKSWGMRAQDECHLIRRKILDILEEKAKKNKSPDVVMMTAFLSPRIHKWLTEGNPKAQIYVLYSDPEKALKGAYDRALEDGHWATSKRILESIRNIGATFHYLFSVETDKGNNLSLHMIDTTDATFEKDADGKTVMKNEKTIVTADQHEGVHIFDMEKLRKIYESYFYDLEQTKLTPTTIRKNMPSEQEIAENLKILFHPHNITFHGPDGQTMKKKQESNILEGNHKHSLMTPGSALKLIYDSNPFRGAGVTRR